MKALLPLGLSLLQHSTQVLRHHIPTPQQEHQQSPMQGPEVLPIQTLD